jgi:hypothetical protein
MEGGVVRCSLVFGGYTLSRDDADANNLNDLWTYDFKSNVWQQVTPATPACPHSPAAVAFSEQPSHPRRNRRKRANKMAVAVIDAITVVHSASGHHTNKTAGSRVRTLPLRSRLLSLAPPRSLRLRCRRGKPAQVPLRGSARRLLLHLRRRALPRCGMRSAPAAARWMRLGCAHGP